MRPLVITEKLTDRNSPGVEQYLRDISRYDLITAEEEVILAKKIKTGDMDALEKMVRANLRFVVSVAKQYQNSGMGLADLINEGNLGLVKAAMRFDETRGFKFISYAVWWIRQSIIQAISEHSRLIRLPLNKIGSHQKIRRAMSELEQKFEREPSPEELAKLLDMGVEQVEYSMGLAQRHVSIDTPFLSDGEQSLLDVMENPNAESADHKISLFESMKTDVREALSELPEQQREVLQLFFGLNGDEPMGLSDIADRLNISPERVRQIKTQGLLRLKTSSHFLKTYMGN